MSTTERKPDTIERISQLETPATNADQITNSLEPNHGKTIRRLARNKQIPTRTHKEIRLNTSQDNCSSVSSINNSCMNVPSLQLPSTINLLSTNLKFKEIKQ